MMINGLINLRKEAGMTSHDAVFKLRKILREKKIGHGGTLDPDVIGVLPIALGKGTRLIEFMQEVGKTYEGEVTLGFSTTTEDASGEVVVVTPVEEELDCDVIDQMMREMTGQLDQVPPMYSAVKVNGRKLYEYARKGETVERPVRQVMIYQFERTSPVTYQDGLARFSFKVVCGKGTYVRTLAVDLGEKLGFATHMSQLTRTESSGMKLADALSLSEIAEKVEKNDFSFLLPIESGLGGLPQLDLTEEEKTELSFGRFISLEREEELLAALYQGQLIAILEKRGQEYKPRKVFI